MFFNSCNLFLLNSLSILDLFLSIELEGFIPSALWYYIGLPRSPYVVGSNRVDCVYRCIDYINPYHNPPPFEFMLGEFYSDLYKGLGHDYISFLRKHGIRAPEGISKNIRPYFTNSRQVKLFYTGRSFFVGLKKFEPERFVRQKRFRRDNKWKPMYDGEKKI